MSKEEFANLLNGRQYRNEITKEEAQLANDHGLLVCFGASDDLLELRGIIDDELGAGDGEMFALYFRDRQTIAILPEVEFEEGQKEVSYIGDELRGVWFRTDWTPKDLKCSWRLKTDLPHATFDIMEDGELYCRGIVVSKTDIEDSLI
jgi:hypothetical protein